MVKNQSRETLINQRKLILETLESLGLLINKEKSALEPTQKIEYLGATFNLQARVMYPSRQRFLESDRLLARSRRNKGQRVPETTGPSGGWCKSYTRNTPSNKTCSVPFPESLESELRHFERANNRDQVAITMVTGGNLFQGSILKIYEGQSPLDRRVRTRLGRSPSLLSGRRD